MQSLDTLHSAQSFWDKVAPKYAEKPVANPEAYEQKLTRVRALMSPHYRMLELGCGTGSTALRLAGSVAEITATDISREMIRIAEDKRAAAGVANVTFAQADAVTELPSVPYDVVAAYSLLHLVDDVPAVLISVHSQLKPVGLFISKTVCLGDANPLLRLFVRALSVVGIAPPVTALTKNQLRRALVDAGFDLLESRQFDKNRLNSFIVAQRPA